MDSTTRNLLLLFQRAALVIQNSDCPEDVGLDEEALFRFSKRALVVDQNMEIEPPDVHLAAGITLGWVSAILVMKGTKDQ